MLPPSVTLIQSKVLAYRRYFGLVNKFYGISPSITVLLVTVHQSVTCYKLFVSMP
ncbi:hypothetical protein BDR07DRAFT_1415985 [Suillus spraguei]|nr:hypothetical protein BDR07DRAFT_1440353 [Suillus spraguei]KAG2359091.1 hypothetical protein BDR07DRAFT_1415985 [Suillus spraguei]